MVEWDRKLDARGTETLFRVLPGGGSQHIFTSFTWPDRIRAKNNGIDHNSGRYFASYEEAIAWCDKKIGGGEKVYKYKELH